MSLNTNLQKSRTAKNDEYYTQYADIERELSYYPVEHFKGKRIYCNCDDPKRSEFWRYFVANFERLGLTQLIATYYAEGKTAERWDYRGAGQSITVESLLGDGDFRSGECREILREVDLVITNPPFSLFREYVTLLERCEKRYLIVGSNNAIGCKYMFPLIRDNKLWLGATRPRRFIRPNGDTASINTCWFTNISHSARNNPLRLTKHYYGNEHLYPKYDNYDAINVDKTADIPADYLGIIGVPLSFMGKYNRDQFEIVGIARPWDGLATKCYTAQPQISASAALRHSTPPAGTYYVVDGHYYTATYARILIRRRS